MANLIKWLGNTAHNVENAVGGAVQGVERAAAPIIRPVAQQVSPVVNAGVRAVGQAIQHPSVQTVQAIPRAVTGAALQQGSRNLMGVTNAIGSSPVVRPVAQFKMPLVGSVGAGVNGLVNEGVIQPFARATGTIGGAMQGQRVQDPRQFLSDVAQTGLNVASGGEGGVALRGAEAGAKQLFKAAGREALVQGKIGAGQGAVQAFRDNAKPLQAATDVIGGGVLGAAGGAAIPFVGAGARAAARGAGDVIKGTTPAIQSVIDKYKASPLADQSGKIGLGQDVTTASQPRKINGQFDQHDLASRPAVNPNDRIAVSKQLINVNSELQSPAVQDFHSRLAEFHGTPGEGAMWQTPLGQRIGSLNEYRNYLSELQAAHGAEGRPVLAPKMSTGRTNMTPQSNGSNLSKLLGNMRTTFGNERGAIGLGQDVGGGEPPITGGGTNPLTGEPDPRLPHERIVPDMGRAGLGPDVAPSRFARRVAADPRANDQLQASMLANGTHDVLHNEDVLKAADDRIAANEDAALSFAKQPRGGTEANATAVRLLDKFLGDGKFEQADELVRSVADRFKRAGQQVQILAAYGRLTPVGAVRYAARQFEKAEALMGPRAKAAFKGMTPEVAKQITAMAEHIQSLPEGGARNREIIKMMQYIGQQMPTSAVDKGIGIYKAGLLSGVRTQTGNGLSNLTLNALKKVSDLPATGYDVAATGLGRGLKAAGLVDKNNPNVGFRTKSLTSGKHAAIGSVEGVKNGWDYLKTGIDVRDLGNTKFDVEKQLNFKHKSVSIYVNGVFRLMGAADQPTWWAAYRDSLADMGRAEAINKRLRGSERRSFIDDFVKNPPAALEGKAANEATHAVLGNDTLASHMVAAAQQGIDRYTAQHGIPGLAPISKAAFNVVMPFTRVPSAFISEVFNYTPVGPVKEVITQAARGKFDQRALSQALGKATTGTAAIIPMGAALAKAGLLTGNYPTDPKEQQLWKAEGKTENSILVHGKWRSLNYLGVLGPLMAVGATMNDQLTHGKNFGEALVTAGAGIAKNTLGQSFLSGVSGALDAINDPTRSAAQFMRSEAASLVPSIVNAVGGATDSLQRQANSVPQAIEGRIPWVRTHLLPKQDAFGNDLGRAAGDGILGAIETFADPFRSSTNNVTPTSSELDRLAAGGNTVAPVPVKTIGSGKDATKLTPQQVYDRQGQVGPLILKAYQDVMANPGYAALSDANKAKALTNAASDVNSVGNVQTLADVAPDKVQKAYGGLSTNQKAMFNGQPSIRDYAALDDTGKAIDTSKLDPKTKFTQDLASYQQQIKAGLLTPEDQYTKGYALAQDQIKSNYPAEVTTLYGMSKTQLANFIAQNPTKEKLLNQVVALDQELTNKGFTQTAKFKYGESSIVAANGSGGFTPASSTASKSGSGRAKKAPSKISSPKVKVTLATAKLVARTHLPKSGSTIHAPKVKMAKAVKTPKLATAKSRKARLV